MGGLEGCFELGLGDQMYGKNVIENLSASVLHNLPIRLQYLG